MKLLPVLFALAFLPAMGQENARVISRVSDMAEGSDVDDIVWYQGESVTLDIKARRGNKPVAWPSSATSVLRVWKADAPGTLYVDKTNAFYTADATRNTLTPAQSNLGTNDYKFAVSVYDSTTFMGIAAEGDLEVRYAPQTGLPMVTPVSIWPSELDDLADVAAPSPDAGQVLGFDGTNWVAVAAGSGSGDLTAITSTDGSITVESGTGPIPNVALPSTLPARNGSLLTAINAATLGGVLPAGYATTNSVANAIAKAHDSVTQGAGDIGTLTGQVRAVTTNQVRAAVAGIYLPLALGGGTTINYGSYGMFVRGGDGILDVVNGIWRGGNGQTSMGVMPDETPYIWFENDTYFSILSLRADTFWLTTNTNNTTLVKLRASLSASDMLTGTIPDSVFPATLPAVSGANLTNLNASNLASGTVSDTVTAAKYRQPVLTWTYRDLTWNTTAAAGWTGYEIESGASGSKRTFGLDAITSAVATDQTGTFKTDWIPVPANFLAFKTTGAIKVTWVSSQAVVGESELRGIRLIGSSDLTGANATDIYTDTTVRDITTTGVPVAVSINRSAFASTTVPAYICVQIDASVEDGDKLAIVSVEVLSE